MYNKRKPKPKVVQRIGKVLFKYMQNNKITNISFTCQYFVQYLVCSECNKTILLHLYVKKNK